MSRQPENLGRALHGVPGVWTDAGDELPNPGSVTLGPAGGPPVPPALPPAGDGPAETGVMDGAGPIPDGLLRVMEANSAAMARAGL